MRNTQVNIDKTMASLDGLQSPEASPLMADRIWQLSQQKVKESEDIGLIRPMAWISGIAVIVVINLAFMNWMGQSQNENESGSLSSQYFDTDISY